MSILSRLCPSQKGRPRKGAKVIRCPESLALRAGRNHCSPKPTQTESPSQRLKANNNPKSKLLHPDCRASTGSPTTTNDERTAPKLEKIREKSRCGLRLPRSSNRLKTEPACDGSHPDIWTTSPPSRHGQSQTLPRKTGRVPNCQVPKGSLQRKRVSTLTDATPSITIRDSRHALQPRSRGGKKWVVRCSVAHLVRAGTAVRDLAPPSCCDA
jgi:hypothetical protein